MTIAKKTNRMNNMTCLDIDNVREELSSKQRMINTKLIMQAPRWLILFPLLLHLQVLFEPATLQPAQVMAAPEVFCPQPPLLCIPVPLVCLLPPLPLPIPSYQLHRQTISYQLDGQPHQTICTDRQHYFDCMDRQYAPITWTDNNVSAGWTDNSMHEHLQVAAAAAIIWKRARLPGVKCSLRDALKCQQQQ